MGYIVVELELDDFGIDEDHLNLIRASLVEDGKNHRVDADRLSTTGRTGYEQVGSLDQVDDDLLALYVLAEHDRNAELLPFRQILLNALAEGDGRPSLVRYLNSYGLLAGNRGDNAD